MKRKFILLSSLFYSCLLFSQNPLYIPPALTGPTFNLFIQNGITQFYPGINTPTFGINGTIMAPTLMVRKWDLVTMNVKNNLVGSGNSTTLHWHGLHVPAMADGGPHQVINQGITWSPQFRILNSAASYWYHPHGDNKTDLHVSKGIAGMIIVTDSTEDSLDLPRNYGIDDFPLIVQTKAFDVLNQIAIATEGDTAVCVNGTVNPYVAAPAQVIRLRIVNGASMRTFNFGFTGNKSFSMIAGDGGLLDSAVTLTRVRLSPGERAEILVDLTGMQGQSITLKSFSSEFPNGIYGAYIVKGSLGGTIPEYDLNPLNGKDFEVLKINIGPATPNAVTTIPTRLTKNILWSDFTNTRNIIMQPDTPNSAMGQVMGPFNINGAHFDIHKINAIITLNNIEKWRVTNNTSIAHPFHIHDMHFYLVSVNGGAVPKHERGKKDVVFVMPNQYVEFITKFEDFTDSHTPYMYHCHLLHHEDDGMMGSFIVVDTTSDGMNVSIQHNFSFYPNPSLNTLTLEFLEPDGHYEIKIMNILGETVFSGDVANIAKTSLDVSTFPGGVYLIEVKTEDGLRSGKTFTQRFIKQ